VEAKFDRKVPMVKSQRVQEKDWKMVEEIYRDVLEYVKVLEKVEIKEGLKIAMTICSRINKFI